MPAARMAQHVSRRDSWPPTTMRLQPNVEAEDAAMDIDSNHDELSLEDDDPINYFLTPTPLLDDGDTDDEMDSVDLEMEMFDAGIQDPSHPQPAIRSISPSDLTGPTRPPSSLPKMFPLPIRSPTPPKARPNSPPSRNSPEALTPNTDHDDDDDDDDEDYVRFTPSGTLAPFGLCHNFSSSKSKGASRKAAAKSSTQKALDKNDRVGMMMAQGPSASSTSLLLLPPDAFHVGRPPAAPIARGRSAVAAGGRGRPRLVQRPRSWSGPMHAAGYHRENRLSPRAWREPSPDVWSIDEDPEAEMLSEFGEGSVEVDTLGHKAGAMTPGGDKAGKKVRFALPVTEIP